MFNCVVHRYLNYKPKQVQAAVIQMADRTKVELFITFHPGCSSPIVLLNLRARNWGFGTCSQGHCRCLLQQVLLEREQDAGERNFIIQKDIAKTCPYSSPQLNFAIYERLHSKWFDLAEGKLSIFIFLSWMAGRNYSTDHSWFSSRPCCNCFARLQTCEFFLKVLFTFMLSASG